MTTGLKFEPMIIVPLWNFDFLEGESLHTIIRCKFCISRTKLLCMATQNVCGDDETWPLISL